MKNSTYYFLFSPFSELNPQTVIYIFQTLLCDRLGNASAVDDCLGGEVGYRQIHEPRVQMLVRLLLRKLVLHRGGTKASPDCRK